MKILVLGGTGRTGRRIVRRLAEDGHQPILFSRRELDSPHQVIVGDLLQPEDIQRAVKQVQTVITALSIPRSSRSPFSKIQGPTDLHSRSTDLLVTSMRAYGVERFIKISAHGVGSSNARAGLGFRALIRASNLAPAFDDHALADQRLATSPLKYTIVRPPMLKDADTVHKLVIDNQQRTWSWTRVTTESVAKWVVDHLDDQATWRRFCSLLPI